MRLYILQYSVLFTRFGRYNLPSQILWVMRFDGLFHRHLMELVLDSAASPSIDRNGVALYLDAVNFKSS